jgi:nucleoside permease NupC
LCGFANLPSIAIQIGGLSAMAPSRRSDFASIAPRAMVAGACACWMTGAVAGLFL